MNERAMQLRVGVMVLATLLIALILLVLFNDPRDLISAVVPSVVSGRKYTVNIEFREAPNVSIDTPVRKSGIRIGRVSHIELPDTGGVTVTARIDGDHTLRHSETFRAASNLLGDAVLEVVVSDSPDDTTPIEDGETLQGHASRNLEENLPGLMSKVEQSIDQLTSAAHKMGTAADEVTAMLKDNRQGIGHAVGQADHALGAVGTVADNLNRLIGDPKTQQRLTTAIEELPEVVGGMKRAVAQAETRLDELAPFSQVLGSKNTVDRVENAVKNLDMVIADFAMFSRQLRNPQGSLGLLMSDRRLYDRLYGVVANVDDTVNRFKPIVSDLRIFSDKIARNPNQLGVRGAFDRGTGIK